MPLSAIAAACWRSSISWVFHNVFNWIAGRLNCFRGRHFRSEKRVFKPEETDTLHSYCRYCGVEMKRRAKRDWLVVGRS